MNDYKVSTVTHFQHATARVPAKCCSMRTLFRATGMSTNALSPLGPFTTLRWSGRYSGSPLSSQGLAAHVSPNYS